MPWFKIDDHFPANAKAQELARSLGRNDPNGLAALGLWTMAGAAALAKHSDGVITRDDLLAITLNARKSRALADRLVAAGLWHENGHDCIRCAAAGPDEYVFHDWFADARYRSGDEYRTDRRKQNERKSTLILNDLWARDCTNPAIPGVANCRYCGVEMKRSDRKSAAKPTMDHVDPSKADGIANLALACAGCNRKKGGRTPEEAGMVLLPAPEHGSFGGDS